MLHHIHILLHYLIQILYVEQFLDSDSKQRILISVGITAALVVLSYLLYLYRGGRHLWANDASLQAFALVRRHFFDLILFGRKGNQSFFRITNTEWKRGDFLLLFIS